MSISSRFFIILSQKPPHMDSSGGVGGSKWLSCILISTCFCILLALVDERSGADSKVCQCKWSNQGPSINYHLLQNLLIVIQIVVGVDIWDQDKFVYDVHDDTEWQCCVIHVVFISYILFCTSYICTYCTDAINVHEPQSGMQI